MHAQTHTHNKLRSNSRSVLRYSYEGGKAGSGKREAGRNAWITHNWGIRLLLRNNMPIQPRFAVSLQLHLSGSIEQLIGYSLNQVGRRMCVRGWEGGSAYDERVGMQQDASDTNSYSQMGRGTATQTSGRSEAWQPRKTR
eukprot:GHVU01037995.1.p1 GENE.GHVU01037995.1~~GHVU01037995.1.p1  ORF type:complete len:140 (+),score=7.32 GHVU01037995.1:500-919(+)